MARHNSVNYSADGGFTYADANSDQFLHGDIQGVGKSFEFHTHDGAGRGLGIGNVAAGTFAARPAAGHAGAIYWAYDTAVVYFDDGSAWHAADMVGGSQTLTGKTLTAPTMTSPTTDKLIVTGPAAVATSTFVGIVSASGAPTSGTWGQYNWGLDEGGGIFLCTVAGTPGTWQQIGGPMTGDLKATLRNTSDAGWTLARGQTVDGTTATYLNLWTYVNANGLVGAGLPFTGTQAALVVPDLRGQALVGVDNMGGVARNLVAALSGPGKTAGEANHTLGTTELPHLAYTAALSSLAVDVTDPTHVHPHPGADSGSTGGNGGTNFMFNGNNAHNLNSGAAATGITAAVHSGTVTVSDGNGGGAHNNIQPSYGVNVSIKL